MTQGYLQIALFCAVLLASVPLLGRYMAWVFRAERLRFTPNLPAQSWTGYARSLLVFSGLSGVVLFVILRTQSIHPFNPGGFRSGSADLSFNTAASFITNTNWQFYGGETTLSNFSQMGGLAVQNFVSAAVGMAVLVALMRGIAARNGDGTLGNFYTDVTRIIFYILVPLSVIATLVLVGAGAVQTLGGTVGGVARGPVASQEAIKLLGTNGGGFFNVNSAFPLENPSALSNFFEMFLILLIPTSLTYTYGRMIGSQRQG